MGEILENFIQRRQKKCFHDGSFSYDSSLTTVECDKCHEKLNPIWVIAELGRREQGYRQLKIDAYEARKALDNKRRTKCEYCGRLTKVRISSADLRAVRDGQGQK